MKKIILFVLLGILIVISLFAVQSYNNFVVLNQKVEKTWAQVLADYQRRFDLIPNLVSVVEGVAKQEREVFMGVAEARAKVGSIVADKSLLDNPEMLNRFNQAQGELSSALSRLLMVQENYPVLKSAENFLSLQNQLEGTENRIAVSRKDFNNIIQEYNTKVKSFPSVIFAKIFGFQEKPYFELQDKEAEKAPKVDIKID